MSRLSFLGSAHLPQKRVTQKGLKRPKQLTREVAMQQQKKAIQPGRIDSGHWRVKAVVLAIASYSYTGVLERLI